MEVDGCENVTIEEAITNELELVNFLLQGGSKVRATEAALRAAALYAAGHRREEALAVTRWAFGIDPAAFTSVQLPISLYAVGDAAIPLFREAVEAHLESGRDDAAFALLVKLVDADPEYPTSRLYLADLHLRRGAVDQAISQLWATLEIFAHHGRERGRVELLRRILFIDNNDVSALRELARAELLRNCPDGSLEALTRLLQLRPTDRKGRELLAETLARADKSGSSMAILRSLVTHYQRSERPELAHALIDRALTWNPLDERFCFALDGLATDGQRALPAAPSEPRETPLRIVAS